jgi:succinate dehydrogenase hydrophobic anchor subunit
MDQYISLGVSVGVALAVFVVFTLIFRWIWNRTMPHVFGVKEVSFWQAIGILILASILFGGNRIVNSDFTSFPRRVQAPAQDVQPT